MKQLEQLFAALAKSKFRSKFRLQDKDLQYLRDKGMPAVLGHARDILTRRLAPAVIPNDGKQTPYKGHPVFVGQHATACCCRECLQTWHGIAAGRELTAEEIDYLLEVLERWLSDQLEHVVEHDDKGPKQFTLPGF